LLKFFPMNQPTSSHSSPLTFLKRNPKIFAWLLLIVLAIIWGTSFILIKRGLLVYSPVQVAAVRVLSAWSLLVGFAFRAFKHIPRKKWFLILISGNLGIFLPSFLFSYAQTNLSSSVSGVLNALTPVFTLIIGVIFFSQKTRAIQLLGFGLAFIGSASLAMLSSPDGTIQFNYYALPIILATVFYGTNTNLTKTYLTGINPLQLTAMALTFIAPFALVILLFSDIQTNFAAKPNSLSALLSIMALGMSSTAIAMVLFNYLIQFTSAVFASSVTYLIPLVAIFWGMVDGELLTMNQIICMIGIMIGVYLANQRK
jgi:drug/metabolite transporter (DMT)-like permease